jgi:general secretion pathway protein D
VNAFSGAGGLRSSGNGQGGGGGGSGQGGDVNPLNAGAGGGGGGGGGNSQSGQGGLNYITRVTLATSPSEAARAFFTALGVNLQSPPGKSVFFNDRLGKLFVKATEQDLDTIERAIEALNEVAPQVHIKSRFIEVQQVDGKALGFDWYLGQFGNNVVASGGTSPSLNVPVTAGSPLGAFPGNTTANVIAGAATDQLLTGGLRNSGPTVATITGILTDPNFRVAIHALEQRQGVETLAEPEVTTTSGRQTQMRATAVKNVVTGFSFNNGTANNGGGGNTGNNNGNGNGAVQQPGVASVQPSTQQVETGPILDVVPYVLSDGYTINLALIPSVTEFIGYDTLQPGDIPGYNPGSQIGNLNGTTLPVALPNFTIRQVVTTVNVWDNQTVVLGGLISSQVNTTKDKVPMVGDLPLVGRLFQSQSKATTKKNLMIFVTATVVDPAGNRVHSDDDLPFAQNSIPQQPPGAGQMTETEKQVHTLPANP